MVKLFPNCSEYVCRLGIKEEEISYIESRLKDLNSEGLIGEFTEYLNKPDEKISSFMDEGDANIYRKIASELMAKRNLITCPFCKENKENIGNHIKEFHREEVKKVLRYLDTEEFHKIKNEIVVDEL
jgi:hypothetical protein